MCRTALILAAHGSRTGSETNRVVRTYADRLARLGLFDEVGVAFHQGEPAFAEALDAVDADDVTVVPLMTSDGFYSDVVLPRELTRNRCFSSIRIRRTRPVGTHSGIVALIARRVRTLLARYDLDPVVTTLAIVGHGTDRHARSGSATMDLAMALARRRLCGEVLPAFLEEEPRVAGVRYRAAHRNIIIEPFLIGAGWHARRDIPAALGLEARRGHGLPISGRVGGRFIVCDDAVGNDPGIMEIILDLAKSNGDGPRATGEGDRTAHSTESEGFDR